MDIGVRYYGTVSYAPNSHACYVRVSISQPDGIPLCIKASFGPLGRHLLKKGAIVCVERASHRDARRYIVTEVIGDRQNQTDEGDSDMAMSKDKIQFYLPYRYYQATRGPGSNGMSRCTCKRVLRQSFDMDDQECERLMQNNSAGFGILCRPSQFARFIVHRYEADECINGIKDLRPEIVYAVDVYQDAAHKVGISRATVLSVLRILRIEDVPSETRGTIDVSKRPHRECC